MTSWHLYAEILNFFHVLIIVKSPPTTRAHSKDNGKTNQNHADFI